MARLFLEEEKDHFHGLFDVYSEQELSALKECIENVLIAHVEVVRISFWISSGAIHFWDEKDDPANLSRCVVMQIHDWLIGWNEIADSIDDETLFERKISLYESSIYKLIYQQLNQFFENKNIKVVWYEEYDTKIAF